MKKSLLLLSAILLLNYCSSFSQTSIPAGNVSGTWTLAGSPYNVNGHITVAQGFTLTIDPGVNVVFQGHYKFNVQGTLLATGTVADTIVFTAANTGTGWWGIRFDNTPSSQDSSFFKYCSLQWSNANGTGTNTFGGGFFFNGFSKANIANSRIANNSAYNGGGIYCSASSTPVITNNTIRNNSVSAYGGGIHCYNSSPYILNNIICNNSAGYDGGGIYCNSSSPAIANNTISNNSASSRGGGIYCDSSFPSIVSNAISNNSVNIYGGGIYCILSSPNIYNCSITNNLSTGASFGGGGLFCEYTSNPVVKNTILWGNVAVSGLGHQVFLNDDPSDPSFNYCDVQGTAAAFETNGNTYSGSYTNNINSDPLFVSPSGGAGTGFSGLTANWALQSSSPCKDAGTPNTTGLNLPAKDLANNPRITPCIVDMGAYEYQYGNAFLIAVTQTATIPCNGYTTAALQVTASGGTPSYTYLWSNNGTTSAISNLGANTYSVSVNDASACVRTATYTITEPLGMTVTPSQTNINCSGNCIGSASVTITGGTFPYTYSWSSGETTSATNSNLCSGPYSVTVTDAGGCSKTTSITITTPSSLGFTTIPLNVSCKNGNNGSITVNATGGNPPYQYSMDAGVNYQASTIFSGLLAATYSIVVKDNSGCQTSTSTLTITEPNLLSVSISHTDVVCYGGTEGTATGNPTGGTAPYTYSWNSSPVQTTQMASALSVGTYTLNLQDAKNCSATASVTISSSLPSVNICMVTVDSVASLYNTIVWEKPVTAGIDSFFIYRNVSAVMVKIGGTKYTDLSMYIDNAPGVDPKIQAYEYGLTAKDTCGKESSLSPTHITIHQLAPNYTSPPHRFDLNWSVYKGFAFTDYEVWRDSSNSGNWHLIGLVPFNLTTTYSDINAPNDSCRYRIQITPSQPCNATIIKHPDPMTTTVKSSKSNGSDRIVNPVSVGAEQKNELVIIYPNPSRGLFTVKDIQHNLQSATVKVYNVLGEVVCQLPNQQITQTTIDLRGNAKGVYHLQLISGNTVINKKLIIE